LVDADDRCGGSTHPCAKLNSSSTTSPRGATGAGRQEDGGVREAATVLVADDDDIAHLMRDYLEADLPPPA
jgi:hypothetical protein